MPADPVILADNAAERQRLETVAARLTDADLGRDLGGGWTVAVALAHLAFWDRRAELVLDRWERAGPPADERDFELLNDALLAEWQAMPGQAAARLAVEAARAADRKVETLAPRVVDAVLARGEGWRLHRAEHRREHLDQIGRALGS